MEEEKERIGHREYIDALFFTHSVPLEGFQRDDSNYTLKNHKKKIVINSKLTPNKTPNQDLSNCIECVENKVLMSP